MDRLGPEGPCFNGVVIQGEALAGPLLGHPTFNLFPKQPVVLRHGTYMATARYGGLRAPALLYWGTRPTLATDRHVSCELHLLDDAVATFTKAYAIEVQVEGFLRPDERFAGVDEVRAQLRADRLTARQLIAGKPAPAPHASLVCGAI